MLPLLLDSLPTWLAWPLGLLFLLSLTGLCYSVGAIIRLNNPEANAFRLPAAQTAFRFTLTQAGRYEVACTRPGQWNNYFQLPEVTLQLRHLATGAVQPLPVSHWHLMKRTDLGGATTLTMSTFTLDNPGEYELLNPDAARFQPGDQLQLLPTTGAKNLLLVLAIVFTGIGTLGSFVVGLLAALGSRSG